MRQWGFLFLTTVLMVALLITQRNSDTTPTPPIPDKTLGQVNESRLDRVLVRGRLICGVNGFLPGFSLEQNGEYSGLDVDICRAVAAALFDNPEAVEYRNLDSNERFIAVSIRDVDLLSRNSTWTLRRDTSFNLEFAPTTFYDGQGMMVRRDSGIRSLRDFQGKKVCVEAGTTSELNLVDKMRELGINYTPVFFQNINAAYDAYDKRQCEGITSDKSQLITRRSTLGNPSDHVLLDEVMSKNPLAPSVINGDPRWFDAVKWIVYALIEAEELGINQANLEQMKASGNPTIRRFLGIEGDLGQSLGLSNDFTQRIIKHVGNYGEIYERNLGQKSQFKLPRGDNDLWTRGGLLYSPPFR